MHDHDLDLIAEYASGLLTGGDRTRAAELVATCSACEGEFTDQQEISRLLAAAPAPTMSEFERTRLRRSVLDQVAPSGSPVSPWQRRFLGAVGAVAAMAVAVVGIGVLGQGEGSDFDQIAAELAADTGNEAPIGALAVDESEGAGDEAGATDRTAEDGVGIFESAASLPLLDLTDRDLADTTDLDPYLADVTQALPPDASTLSVDEAVTFGAGCATTIDDPLLGVVIAMIDGTRIEVFLTGTPAEPTLTMLDAGTCVPHAP